MAAGSIPLRDPGVDPLPDPQHDPVLHRRHPHMIDTLIFYSYPYAHHYYPSPPPNNQQYSKEYTAMFESLVLRPWKREGRLLSWPARRMLKLWSVWPIAPFIWYSFLCFKMGTSWSSGGRAAFPNLPKVQGSILFFTIPNISALLVQEPSFPF